MINLKQALILAVFACFLVTPSGYAATIQRLHSDTIVNNHVVNASDLDAEFNQLVNEANSKETRLTTLESGTTTVSGNKTYSGTSTFTGAVSASNSVTLSNTVTLSGTVTTSGTNNVTGVFNVSRSTNPTTPSDGTLWYNSSTKAWSFQTNGSAQQLDAGTTAIINESETSGTSSDAITLGSWVKRTLNTEVSDTSNIVSISSSQFTLGAGTYDIIVTVPWTENGSDTTAAVTIQARLFNYTDSTVVAYSTPVWVRSGASSGASGNMNITTRITLTGSKAFQVEEQASSSLAHSGWAAGFGGTEVYTTVYIRKVF